MFMSGFGVFSSYLSKGDSYIKNFPRYRILPVYCSYLFFLLLYVGFYIYSGYEITAATIFHSLTYGGTIVSFGWYIQLTLLLYLLFYVLKRLIRNDHIFMIALTFSIIVLMTIHFFLLYEKNVYEPAACFMIGVAFAYYDSRKVITLNKMCWTCALTGLVSFVVFTILSTLMVFRLTPLMDSNRWFDALHLFLMVLTDLSLIIFMLAFIVIADRYIPGFISNPVSRFLGKHSFEAYALQGLFFSLLIYKISNRAVFAMVAVFCIIIFSVPIHKFLCWLKRCLTESFSLSCSE